MLETYSLIYLFIYLFTAKFYLANYFIIKIWNYDTDFSKKGHYYWLLLLILSKSNFFVGFGVKVELHLVSDNVYY